MRDIRTVADEQYLSVGSKGLELGLGIKNGEIRRGERGKIYYYCGCCCSRFFFFFWAFLWILVLHGRTYGGFVLWLS